MLAAKEEDPNKECQLAQGLRLLKEYQRHLSQGDHRSYCLSQLADWDATEIDGIHLF